MSSRIWGSASGLWTPRSRRTHPATRRRSPPPLPAGTCAHASTRSRLVYAHRSGTSNVPRIASYTRCVGSGATRQRSYTLPRLPAALLIAGFAAASCRCNAHPVAAIRGRLSACRDEAGPRSSLDGTDSDPTWHDKARRHARRRAGGSRLRFKEGGVGSPLLSESPGRTRSRSLNAIHKAHPELVGLTPLYPLPLLSSLLSPLATFSSLPSILSLSSPLSSLLSPLSSLSPPSTPSLRHSQRLFDDHSAGARISLAPPPPLLRDG